MYRNTFIEIGSFEITFMVVMLIVCIGSIFLFAKEIIDGFPDHLELCMALLSLGLVVTAIYGFYKINKTTRLQTSIDFCLKVYPYLQSKEFVQQEQYLIEELNKRNEEAICAIEDIKDEKLKQEILKYCEYMDGLGIIVYEHMINYNVIIPYIGVNTILIYRKLIPYLNRTREARARRSLDMLTIEENEKIQQAASLYFIHYELLALEIERQGPEWTKRFQNELKTIRK